MKKKVLASLLCLSMAATLFAGCGSSNGGNGTESGKSKSGSDKKVTIWSAESVSKLTEELATKWVKENYPDYSVEVQSVGETDAAKNVITDVDGAADIYGFAQDQLARLVAAGALQPLTDEYKTWVTDNNDSGASTAATIDSMTYAFPMTSDNGYFLIYDKSIISDPSNLDQILKDCEDNGKQFYYEFTSAWYNAAVYLGAGAECTFDIDKEGNFTKANTNYASPEGVVALRKLIDIANSPATVDASALTAITDTQNVGAFVGGAWTINDSKETKDPDGEPDSGDEESYVAPGLNIYLEIISLVQSCLHLQVLMESLIRCQDLVDSNLWELSHKKMQRSLNYVTSLPSILQILMPSFRDTILRDGDHLMLQHSRIVQFSQMLHLQHSENSWNSWFRRDSIQMTGGILPVI